MSRETLRNFSTPSPTAPPTASTTANLTARTCENTLTDGGYTEPGQIAAHARDAMQWAVDVGIISGMTATTLGPNGLANRAQIAVIISRFVPKYLW